MDIVCADLDNSFVHTFGLFVGFTVFAFAEDEERKKQNERRKNVKRIVCAAHIVALIFE